MSSARFEDLKDELLSLEEKIKLQMKHNINDVTLNKLCSEGDLILNMMKREVDSSPVTVNGEMRQNWMEASNNWRSFKANARTTWESVRGNSGPNETLARGVSILERTNESLIRAEMVARESEAIGTETINELGTQRESLIRTRERLDNTSDDLKKTHVLLRSINRRVLTNKCLLIFIIIVEILILLLVIYIKFIRK